MNPLVELLGRLRAVLERVPDDVYSAKPLPTLSGSVGEHVRHCLDHVATLAEGWCAPGICYDRRLRATSDETHRPEAIRRIDRLTGILLSLDDRTLSRPLVVECLLQADGVPTLGRSSVGRELAFVVHHTLHHFAVVALLLDHAGVSVPARFAHAPSTLKAA